MLSEESGRGKACTASTELSAAHCSHGCHLTHAWLIRSGGQRTWTFLLNMRCFKYITLLSPHPLPDITMRRSSATCQLPKSICYPATIIEAMDGDDVSVLHEHPGAKLDACSWNIINIITKPGMRKKKRKRRKSSGHRVPQAGRTGQTSFPACPTLR